MDLISKKAAVSRISDLLVLELKGKRIPTWNEVYNAIGDIPAVPAVPVIRCEDCKHMHAVNLPDGQSWHYCPYMKFDVDPDFYCARGERR